MPIAPVIERGSITIKIRALSQITKQNLEIPLEILVINFIKFAIRCPFIIQLIFVARRSDYKQTHVVNVGPERSRPRAAISRHPSRRDAGYSLLEISALFVRQSESFSSSLR